MAESDRSPLLQAEESQDVSPPPPPSYVPVDPPLPKRTSDVPLPTYPSSMPLPTYAQSEKYEREGVLEYDPETDSEREPSRSLHRESQEEDSTGSCCEFIVFFIICTIFGLVGFIFAICFATTVAAQSGAVAGLGIAFVGKPIMFESYEVEYKQYLWNYCSNSTHWWSSDGDVEKCARTAFSVLRFFFWMIGLLGLVLLYKGVSNFTKTRGSRRN